MFRLLTLSMYYLKPGSLRWDLKLLTVFFKIYSKGRTVFVQLINLADFWHFFFYFILFVENVE